MTLVKNRIEIDNALLKMNIAELELPVRAHMVLMNNHIETIGQLINFSEDQLLNLKHCGRKSLNDIKIALEDLNITLKHQPQRFEAPKITPDSPIEDLNLSARTERILRAANVITLRQLTELSTSDLLRIHSFGHRPLREIRKQLARYSLTLKGEE